MKLRRVKCKIWLKTEHIHKNARKHIQGGRVDVCAVHGYSIWMRIIYNHKYWLKKVHLNHNRNVWSKFNAYTLQLTAIFSYLQYGGLVNSSSLQFMELTISEPKWASKGTRNHIKVPVNYQVSIKVNKESGKTKGKFQ